MDILGMNNEKGEQAESTLHSNPSIYEQEYNQPSFVQEECYNLFYEECNQPVTNSICGVFQEYFSPPIYDEYEDVNWIIKLKNQKSAIKDWIT